MKFKLKYALDELINPCTQINQIATKWSFSARSNSKLHTTFMKFIMIK